MSVTEKVGDNQNGKEYLDLVGGKLDRNVQTQSSLKCTIRQDWMKLYFHLKGSYSVSMNKGAYIYTYTYSGKSGRMEQKELVETFLTCKYLKVENTSNTTTTKSLQLCLTLCDPMDCSLPGSYIHGIFWATVLEWGAIAFSPSNSLHNTCINGTQAH